MTNTLSVSTDMLKNYLHGELISPQKKFEALQTTEGTSLLWSIGTDGVFYLIAEESAKSVSGWSKLDLSSALVKADFKDDHSASAATFEAAVSVEDQSLGLALAIGTKKGDALYLSLGNKLADARGWTAPPEWTAVPFDAEKPPKTLKIANIFFAETSGKTQYIVVDILRDPDQKTSPIIRYYVDPDADGPAWVLHDIAIDIQADSYGSAVGRLPGSKSDGIYTAGHEASAGQMVFTPVVNAFGPGPAAPIRLELPDKAIPGAIAASRKADGTSDLFVVSGSTLHFFAADAQKDNAVATTLVTHDVISQTSKLHAMEHEGVVTIWGLNASKQVYYLSAESTKLAQASAWSHPVPILQATEEISPYLNAADGGNTIFASGGGKLERMVQATSTSSKLWRAEHIALPAEPTTPALNFNSYTTTLSIADETGMPAGNAKVALSAGTRTTAYINGIYYILGPKAVTVEADATGIITIIDATTNLSGAILTATPEGGTATEINPMHGPFKKASALDTADKLKQAKYTASGGGKKPLVSPKASNLDQAADGLKNLGKSYGSISGKTAFAVTATPELRVMPTGMPAASDPIAVAAGDLFNFLKHGFEGIVHVVEDAASGLWRFVVKIADATYRAVLDTVEAVVGAVEWVFKAIGTALEDLIRFLEFLFDWDDIKLTKKVMESVVKNFLKDQIDLIPEIKQKFNQGISEVESTINDWAGIKDWSGIGEQAAKPASGSAKNPNAGQTSGSQLLTHHVKTNAGSITLKKDLPSQNVTQELLNDMIEALEQEGEVIAGVVDQIKELAKQFSKLSVGEVLKRLAAIFADAVLSSLEVVVDAILNVLEDLAQSAMGILTTPLHIPVVSDILEAAGIKEFSFFDLVLYIGAIAYTVVYKIAEDKAPFKDDAETKKIIQATSMKQLQALFGQKTMSVGADVAEVPVSLKDTVFVMGHLFGGIVGGINTFFQVLEAKEDSGQNSYALLTGVLGLVSAGMVFGTNYLMPKDPISVAWVSWSGRAVTGITVISKIVFSGPVQKRLGSSKGILQKGKAEDGRAVGSIINAVLVIPSLAVTIYHFYEIGKQHPSDMTEQEKKDRVAAILDETSNVASYIGRVSYTVAANSEGPVKIAAIVVMALGNLAFAGLQAAEATQM